MNEESVLVLKGFDVVVQPSLEDGDNFEVTLMEGGNEVFNIVIPIPVDEDSEMAYSEELINYAAQAAIDIYEADRDTLGQGAGATMKESMKKQACCVSSEWEDWYLKLKGTAYEEQAVTLLNQYVDSVYSNIDTDLELSNSHNEERRIEYELDMFNLERLKSVDPKQTIIIINASSKKACGFYDVSQIQEYMDKFKGCVLEGQAIAKMRELMEVKSKINNLYKSMSEKNDEGTELKAAMNELLLQCVQQGVIESAPSTGMESAPMMANDIAELMEGVDLHAPLEPMIARTKVATLPNIDKKVIEAFSDKQPAEGKWLSTDGVVLEKLGLGGEEVAHWEDEYVYVTSTESVKSDDVILRFLMKTIPKNWLKFSYNRGDYGTYGEDDNKEAVIAKSKKGISRKEIERMMEKRRRDREESGDEDLEDEDPRSVDEIMEILGDEEFHYRNENPGDFRRGNAAKRAFNEVDEDHLVEFGEQHKGLDPAEIAIDDYVVEVGDKVTFKNKFEDVGAGGVIGTIEKGTSAVVDSLWDGHGNCVLVSLESGRVVKAPVSILKKS